MCQVFRKCYKMDNKDPDYSGNVLMRRRSGNSITVE